MIQIQNITDDPFQHHIITSQDAPIELFLRFYPRAQFWTFDFIYKGIEKQGFKLTMGTMHIRSQNMPFDFILNDTTGTGIDPFKADDFSGGRVNLILLEAADMEAIRGQPVPL